MVTIFLASWYVWNVKENYTNLQVMLEFEGLLAFRALEFSKDGTFVVADHMALQTVDVCECFVANLAGLKIRVTVKNQKLNYTEIKS